MADSDARSTGMLFAFGALTCLMILFFVPAAATAQDADEELILEEEIIEEEAPVKKTSGFFGGLKAILKRDKPGDAAEPADDEDAEDVIEPADVPETTADIPAAPAADVPAAPAAVDEDGKGVAGLLVSVCSAATQQHWRMFVHYFRLARFDLSVEEGQKVLDANVDPKVMLTLAETRTTGYDTLVQMMTVDEMGDVPSRVLTLVDKGMYERRTDPVRIAKNLERLARGPRAYFLALRELKRSGPYVVPHALAMLQDPASQDKLTPSLVRGLIEIGRPVVLPLTYALATKDQNLKQTICDVLGPIGYQYALPALKAVVENKTVSEVTRKAATKAIKDISGDTKVLKTPSKVLYLELARKYHNREISGIADSRLPKTDIFGWDAVKGLTYKAVPTSIVGEVLCARACVDALKADPSALDAVALWMASQMRIKAKLPDATVKDSNPFSPAGMPEVEFFALALGEQYLCEVLSGALKEGDVVVALQAIEALEKVAD
ncbi:MAG: hypothetical protein QF662_05165, partial [Phycisphaerae bacterium]|nr:hypothetical protein [Phycisphaerae bacterium]